MSLLDLSFCFFRSVRGPRDCQSRDHYYVYIYSDIYIHLSSSSSFSSSSSTLCCSCFGFRIFNKHWIYSRTIVPLRHQHFPSSWFFPNAQSRSIVRWYKREYGERKTISLHTFSWSNIQMAGINALLVQYIQDIENIFDLTFICTHYYLKMNGYSFTKNEQVVRISIKFKFLSFSFRTACRTNSSWY